MRSSIGGWLMNKRATPPAPEMPNACTAFGKLGSRMIA